MRAGAAVHGGGLVHDFGKGRHAAVERFGDEVGALVGGAHHGAVEQVLEIDALPHVQAHVRAVVADVGSGLRQVDGLVHITHHDAQKHGHDLGGRSGIHGGVRILFKNHLAGGCFDEDGRLGVELVLVKILRMLRIVGLHIAGELRFDIVDDVFLFGDSMEPGSAAGHSAISIESSRHISAPIRWLCIGGSLLPCGSGMQAIPQQFIIPPKQGNAQARLPFYTCEPSTVILRTHFPLLSTHRAGMTFRFISTCTTSTAAAMSMRPGSSSAISRLAGTGTSHI